MKKLLPLSFSLLMALLLLSGYVMPPSCQQGTTFEFTGKISEIDYDLQTLTIISLDGSVTNITTSNDTTYTGAATHTGFPGLQKDLQIIARGTKTPDNVYAADEIYLVPVSYVSGSLDASAIPGINSYKDVAIQVSGIDGSSFTYDLNYQDGSFNLEVRIVPQLQVTITFINKSTGATVGVLVFDVNASGMKDMAFPVTTQSGMALVITLGVVSTPALPPFGAASGDVVFLTPQNNPDEQVDTDNDGMNDLDDSDDDNNGIPDVSDDKNKDQDPDGDLLPNKVDPDDDNDGISDKEDTDSDGNGIDDLEERDSDKDGVKDEKDVDIDNDGKTNGEDDDDNNDGIKDDKEKDTDKDGNPDYKDNDLDGDGIKNDQDDDDDGDGVKDVEDPDSCYSLCQELDNNTVSEEEIKECDCNVANTVIAGYVETLYPDEKAFSLKGLKIFTNDNTRYLKGLTGYESLLLNQHIQAKAGKLIDGSIIAFEVKQLGESDVEKFKVKGTITTIDATTQSFTVEGLNSSIGAIPIYSNEQTKYQDGLTQFADLAVGLVVEASGDVAAQSGDFVAAMVKKVDPNEVDQEQAKSFGFSGLVTAIDQTNQTFTLTNEKGVALIIAVNEFTVFDGASGLDQLKLNQQAEAKGVVQTDTQSGQLSYLAQQVKVKKGDKVSFDAAGKILEINSTEQSFKIDSNGVEAWIFTSSATKYDGVADFSELLTDMIVKVSGFKDLSGKLLADKVGVKK